ncbi:MAG: hypothetical protein WCO10_03355 [bacterium]
MDKKARQQASKIINSSVQVLNELPKDAIEKMGGEAALVKRTKINLVDSLGWSGMQFWQEKIDKIDANRINRVDDFIGQVRNVFETSLA